MTEQAVSPGGTDPWSTPYWWQAAPRQRFDHAPLPDRADVVIVGAGFTGTSAALVLARAGRNVVLLDSGAPGQGASSRNGGQVGSGNQKFKVAALIAQRGEAKATALLREGTAMLGHIGDLITREGIACDYTICGRFRGCVRPEHYDAMARDMEDLRRVAGVTSYMVPKAEQRREIGSDYYHGGSVLPADASLHPGKYHGGLLDLARAAGASVHGFAAATAITRDGPGFVVTTARGRIATRNVIVATNGYTGDLVPHLRRRMVTVHSAIIASEPLAPGVIDRLMPKRRVYGCTARVFHYFRPSPDGTRILWGGRVGGARRGDAQGYRHLAAEMARVFPELAGAPIAGGWSGQIGYTFDDMPHLGVVDGIHYALGYCGTGVSRATWFGDKIAKKVLGDPDGASAFDDLIFPSHPFWFAARSAVPWVEAWYRLRDSL
ncbi:NAD(P)/FAD-dependent oxidoreductase [Zavarzinia sp.]|uniref:NAD(P)/FAD-dependent oxidoreductase n=1 Tax=Zavarzinia sp. TaxID=2027920 RepID=UPI003BB7337C|nr:FAD-binding oxidoreductase [Zavarzinia sp.]